MTWMVYKKDQVGLEYLKTAEKIICYPFPVGVMLGMKSYLVNFLL